MPWMYTAAVIGHGLLCSHYLQKQANSVVLALEPISGLGLEPIFVGSMAMKGQINDNERTTVGSMTMKGQLLG